MWAEWTKGSEHPDLGGATLRETDSAWAPLVKSEMDLAPLIDVALAATRTAPLRIRYGPHSFELVPGGSSAWPDQGRAQLAATISSESCRRTMALSERRRPPFRDGNIAVETQDGEVGAVVQSKDGS